jgi:outer membrane protein TolC
MIRNKHLIILILGLPLFNQISAQDYLTKEEAVERALEHNLGVKLSMNASEIALNNTSKYNTGQLPTVSLNGGYNFQLDNTNAKFQNGDSAELTFAESQGASASIAANYVVFDGFFRKFNIQQLKEQFNLSNIQAEATMENVAAQTLTQYYQIGLLQENLNIIREGIEISLARLDRAEQLFEYGQSNKLVVLNARVDLNNDSLAFYNAALALDNAKRQLNNLMADNSSLEYDIDTDFGFIENLDYEVLKQKMLNDNISLAQIDRSIEIGNISTAMINARKLPTLSTNVSYGYSFNKNNSASFLSSLNSNGLNAGVTLSWNLFDGGVTRHALEQNRLNNISLQLQKEQQVENLILEFENAWANYTNSLFVYDTQINNVEISKANFKRSEAQFEIGQINSVDYRQAQLNLLNAQTALNTSRFQVKVAEVQLLLLSGSILN